MLILLLKDNEPDRNCKVFCMPISAIFLDFINGMYLLHENQCFQAKLEGTTIAYCPNSADQHGWSELA